MKAVPVVRDVALRGENYRAKRISREALQRVGIDAHEPFVAWWDAAEKAWRVVQKVKR